MIESLTLGLKCCTYLLWEVHPRGEFFTEHVQDLSPRGRASHNNPKTCPFLF